MSIKRTLPTTSMNPTPRSGPRTTTSTPAKESPRVDPQENHNPNNTSLLTGPIRRLLAWCIPKHIKVDSEPYLRAEAFVFMTFCAVILTAILALNQLARGDWISALIQASMTGASVLMVWLYKRDWQRQAVQIFFFSALVTGMSADAYLKGGFYGSDVAWLMLSGLMGGLVWGARGALVWSVICLTISIVFLAMHAGEHFAPLPHDFMIANNAMTAFLLIVIGAIFMIIVQNWFTQAHKRREMAMKVLAERNHALSEAITRQEQLEKRMAHSQKQESLGLLAGGVAHDFNNLLFGVTAELDLALSDMEDTQEVEASIKAALMASRKASDLTRLLLTYAGKRPIHRQEHRLEDILGTVTQLARSTLPRTMKIRGELEGCSAWVHCDATQLEQVFLNLLLNAGDACDGQGLITISWATRALTAADLEDQPLNTALRPGPHVCISVADDGCGMDEDTQKRIFEPFFTTKFTGRGLGLAVTEGILRAHQGAINLESTPGEGTRFTIILPEHPHAQTQADKDAASSTTLPLQPRAGSQVLIIDDEVTVRESLMRQLQHLGIDALPTSSGTEGLERFVEHKDHLNGVILDLTMPDLSGEEVLGKLRKLTTDMPVLLVSGYSVDDVMLMLSKDPKTRFLSKPFGLGELRTALEWMLGAGCCGSSQTSTKNH